MGIRMFALQAQEFCGHIISKTMPTGKNICGSIIVTKCTSAASDKSRGVAVVASAAPAADTSTGMGKTLSTDGAAHGTTLTTTVTAAAPAIAGPAATCSGAAATVVGDDVFSRKHRLRVPESGDQHNAKKSKVDCATAM
mmetsp:Transcript_25556/g.66926  ORF Transcript_25556/g.66926 Transcript_25556/m.66926 type:complete len:139 (-) Transcript_25556:469-885(-)